MPTTSGWRKAFVVVGIFAGLALIVAAIIIPVYLVPLLTGTTSMYAPCLWCLRARRISLKYESCRRTTKKWMRQGLRKYNEKEFLTYIYMPM